MNSIIHNDKKNGQDKKVGSDDPRRRNRARTRPYVSLQNRKSTKLNHTRSTIETCQQMVGVAVAAVFCKSQMWAGALCPSLAAYQLLIDQSPGHSFLGGTLWSAPSWTDFSRQYFLKYFFFNDGEKSNSLGSMTTTPSNKLFSLCAP